ncbi:MULTISPECIES: hypothetical protein [unclassified Pseudoxanthomonas]|jgi:REP element-mobilizing transposase RayT|uniref:hypothetical protein n=1 Tax=unclassified Pseudoxanthomonas TaxID=2645906 RepID=UPI00307D54D1
MDYRRICQEGSTYFFTVNLAERSGTLLVDRIDDLRAAVHLVEQRHPFDMWRGLFCRTICTRSEHSPKETATAPRAGC